MRSAIAGSLGLAVLVLLATPRSTQASVEAGPIVNPTNGNRYYLLAPNTWLAAEAEALALGGHLVAIGDAVENTWVWNTFAGGGPLWIGLSDAVQEGSFVWSSGEPYGYTSWWVAGGEPNNAGGVENYVEINNGVWNDTDGFGPNGAVVEVEDEPLFRFVEAEPIPLPPVEIQSAMVGSFSVSPDGRHVYALYGVAIGDDKVLVYERGADGALTLLDQQVVAGNPMGMALTPDGSTLFVVSNNGELQAWQRTPATGLLALVDSLYDGQRGATYLNYARDVAVSPDGANVYVVGQENAITSFAWDGATLTVVDTDVSGSGGLSLVLPSLVAVTPDGNFALAVSPTDAALVVFERDPATGALDYVESFLDDVGGVDGLWSPVDLVAAPTSGQNAAIHVPGAADGKVATFSEGPVAAAFDVSFLEAAPALSATYLAVSPDGTLLYATDGIRNGLNAFVRDPVTGAIGGIADSVFDTDIDVDGLYGPIAVAVSPDGRSIYTSGGSEGVIGVFEVVATPEPGAVPLGLAALFALRTVARRRRTA